MFSRTLRTLCELTWRAGRQRCVWGRGLTRLKAGDLCPWGGRDQGGEGGLTPLRAALAAAEAFLPASFLVGLGPVGGVSIRLEYCRASKAIVPMSLARSP